MRYFRRGAHRQNGFRVTVADLLTESLHTRRNPVVRVKYFWKGEPV